VKLNPERPHVASVGGRLIPRNGGRGGAWPTGRRMDGAAGKFLRVYVACVFGTGNLCGGTTRQVFIDSTGTGQKFLDVGARRRVGRIFDRRSEQRRPRDRGSFRPRLTGGWQKTNITLRLTSGAPHVPVERNRLGRLEVILRGEMRSKRDDHALRRCVRDENW